MTYWDEADESPDFSHGFAVGKSRGQLESYYEAQNAYNAGEIELWLEFNAPKTLEEWDTWDETHGENFSDRWKGIPHAD